MRSRSKTLAVLIIAGSAALTSQYARAGEGKWTPQQVLQLDAQWLKQQGLQIPVSRLWDPRRGTGLLAAAVSVPGCSAAFVSASGLVLTNHHCLFSLIQEHSTPQRDLITNGFIAHSREEELPGKTMRVTVPRKFTDVTKEVENAVPAGAADAERSKAMEAKQKELVAACEKNPSNRCNVSAFDGGLQYVLIEAFELTDIRLVYAPPRAIGEFGGEVDNYQWPRHVGDFSMARAYKDGKPYTPEFYFPISRAGVKVRDFVMVLGYPGRTYRSLTAEEMANEQTLRYQLDREVYGEWIKLLEQTTQGSPEGQIAVAATLKSLNNSHTRAEGQLAGLARGHLIEKQKANDDAAIAWAAARPRYSEGIAAKKELDRLAEQRRNRGVHDYLLSVLPAGSLTLRDAVILVRLASERQKPDAEREAGYQIRDMQRLQAFLERDQKSFYAPADEALLRSWLTRAQKQDIAAARGANANALLQATMVSDPAERSKMFEETEQQLRDRKDPMLDLAFALEPELREWRARTDARDGAVARLRPEWRRAVIAHAGQPVAPDANNTLRVSFAHVMGYSPRDGVTYLPHTTLAGMVEKNTGEEPFAVPQFILDAAKATNAMRIPVDFLSDADTTGGNSGSPVVNGRGDVRHLEFQKKSFQVLLLNSQFLYTILPVAARRRAARRSYSERIGVEKISDGGLERARNPDCPCG